MSSNFPDIETALTGVAAAFDRLGVQYRICGSLASSAHGIARATMDADLVTNLRVTHIDLLVDALQDQYYIDADALRSAIAAGSMNNIVYLASMLKIDIYVVRPREFDRVSFSRYRSIPLSAEPGARTFVFSSPEDTILHKLDWYKAGGEVSERQWNDVLGVIRVQSDDLDWNYLTRWAKAIDVSLLLDTASDEVGQRDC